VTDAPPSPDDERVRAPGWTRAIPPLGRLPALPNRQWKLLGLLGAAEFADHYDIALFTMLLLQIQAGLGIAEGEIGVISAVIRMGVVLAVGAGLIADRLGRRRVLLVTVVGYTLTTFLTAFARDAGEFALLQLLGRGFLYAETAVAIVVVTEELAARDRGFGLGLLGALGAMGHGAASLALSFVEEIPFGWRALYALGALPLLALAWLRRELPETSRYVAARPERTPWWHPLRSLARAYPGRLAALVSLVFAVDFAIASAVYFMVKALQETHGWERSAVTTLYLAGGALAILGNQFAGQLSDRVGRRPLLIALLLVAGVGFAGFYWSPWDPLVAACWIAQVFALQGATVLERALGGELFPTSYRSTASSMRMLAATIGGSVGLALESVLYGVLGSHTAAITALLPALAVAVAIVVFAIPETAGRELEEVSPERLNS
jgi:putative MFS transporter